jgi:hypothetical protein
VLLERKRERERDGRTKMGFRSETASGERQEW